jgi:hypothetical protein
MENIDQLKYTIKIVIYFAVTVMFSCSDDNTHPYDQSDILASQDETGFVRLSKVESSEVNLNDFDNSSIDLQLEAYDSEEGDLLQDVEFTVEFIDNTPENGTNSIEAMPLAMFPASMWTRGDDILPTISTSFDIPTIVQILGISTADIYAADILRLEWTLNLTNGKSFNRHNQSNSLSSWPFYNAPALLDVSIVCSIPDDFATGSYYLLQTEWPYCPFFGCDNSNIFERDDVDITIGVSSDARIFEFNWIGFPSTMQFSLACGERTVVNAEAGANCGNGVFWVSDDESGYGKYDYLDDSVITLRFWGDYENDCGLRDIFELKLTKN